MGLALSSNVTETVEPQNPIEFGDMEEGPGRAPRLSHNELIYLERLKKKHGDNYRMMVRDLKLNFYQLTKKTLKKKFKIYNERYQNGVPSKDEEPAAIDEEKGAEEGEEVQTTE
eukprot:TRINITY_DN449_c0_g1_i1.p1 TRINITY_DN449_c0_g1~~TRINITY_DN449_c0_g1_i1.p1  ORF type:complete len:114 (-),score=29.32 TRINITY_DN449_c0_g1_i1:54-395(-)